MGIVVSTWLTFVAHATLIWVGSGVLCSLTMTYAMKTHSFFLLRFILALYPRGSFVLSCTTALHFDYLHLLALSRLHLDSCLSQILTMMTTKIKLAYLWLLQLDTPWPVERTYLWVSPTSFRLPALSIGKFPSQELDHLFHRHSFFPLYHNILLFFFKLNRKRKKN